MAVPVRRAQDGRELVNEGAIERRRRLEIGAVGSSRVSETATKEVCMPITRETTKEQLYREAKRLRIKGRSRMNKGQLKSALTRHGH